MGAKTVRQSEDKLFSDIITRGLTNAGKNIPTIGIVTAFAADYCIIVIAAKIVSEIQQYFWKEASILLSNRGFHK